LKRSHKRLIIGVITRAEDVAMKKRAK
jgi:hypothetical protein